MNYKTILSLVHCSIIQFRHHVFAVLLANGVVHACKSLTSAVLLAEQLG